MHLRGQRGQDEGGRGWPGEQHQCPLGSHVFSANLFQSNFGRLYAVPGCGAGWGGGSDLRLLREPWGAGREAQGGETSTRPFHVDPANPPQHRPLCLRALSGHLAVLESHTRLPPLHPDPPPSGLRPRNPQDGARTVLPGLEPASLLWISAS